MTLNMMLDALFSIAGRQLVQLSAVILIVGLMGRIFLRRRQQLAYGLLLLALVKSLTPPIWSSRMGLFSWTEARTQNQSQINFAAQSAGGTTSQLTGNPPQGLVRGESSRKIDQADESPSFAQQSMPALRRDFSVQKEAAHVYPAPSITAPPARQARSYWKISDILLSIWAAGSCAMLLLVLVRASRIRRAIIESSHPLPPDVARVLEKLRESMGLRRKFSAVVCDQPIGPALFGLFRPILVIPRALLESKTAAQLRPVLAHELIHLRRGDSLVGGVQLLCQCLWWFHPLVWWMNVQINRTREICCDGEVIAALNCEPVDYAQMLLDVMRLRGVLRSIIPSLGVRPVEVTRQRLNHVMQDGPFHRPRYWVGWMVVSIGGLLLLPGAGISSRGADSAATAQQTQPAGQDAAGKNASAAQISAGGSTSRPASSQPALALGRVRHFVRVVFDAKRMTFEGKDTTLDQLPSLLEKVPDRRHTVLELAIATEDMTVGQLEKTKSNAAILAELSGFEYLSYIGVHPIGSSGSPDLTMEATDELGLMAQIDSYSRGLQDLLIGNIKNELEASKAEAAYKKFVDQVNQDQDPPAVTEMIAADAEVAQLSNMLKGIQKALDDLKNNGGANDQTRASLQRRQEAVSQRLDNATAAARVKYRASLLEQLKLQMVQATEKLAATAKQIDSFRKQLEDIKAKTTLLVQRQDEHNAILARMEARRQAEQNAIRELNALKKLALQREAVDQQHYTKEQLQQADDLYQTAKKNWRGDAAIDAVKQLLEKFPGANTTGCALLHIGESTSGDEQLKYLTQAVEKYSDCFDNDSCQVGGFARLLLAEHYKQNGQPDKAQALYDEIRKDYPNAINHDGQLIVKMIPQ
jgi:beta-lactamase regulating signal transducer with metallopeptidase domain